MRYCNQHGIPCDNANQIGYCTITGCTKRDVIFNNYENKVAYDVNYKYCEICGNKTQSNEEHLCRKCQNALRDIIYGKR